MLPREDVIVEIPENRLKFFGGAGKMLLPSSTTVAALIKKIPERKLITTSLLCKSLAERFEVQGTCPVTTQKALQEIAHDADNQCPYWRVVNATGGLIARFPGGVGGHAALLKKEGFAIDTKQKTPKVKDFSESLVRFAPAGTAIRPSVDSNRPGNRENSAGDKTPDNPQSSPVLGSKGQKKGGKIRR